MLKEITAYIKNSELSKEWYVFVDWQTFYGQARPLTDPQDFREEVEMWIGGGWEKRGEPQYEYFHTLFRDIAMKVIPGMFKRRGVEAKVVSYTKENILGNPWLIGSEGTSNNVEPRLKRALKEYPSEVRNKWLMAMTLSESELERILFTSIPSKPKAFQKYNEILKLRSIISVDLPLHAKMSVMLHYFNATMEGMDAITPIFSGGNWLTERFVSLESRIKAGSIPVNIDQSAFDSHVSGNMILAIVEALTEGVRLSANLEEKDALLELMDLIAKDILPKEVYIKGDDPVPYVGGVLSGWTWTALLDTLVNYIEVLTIVEMLESTGTIPYRREQVTVQGDDAVLLVDELSTAFAVVAMYNWIGFDVNLLKFSMDTNVEFLRLFALPVDEGQVFGYPGRIVSSLLYRSSDQRPAIDEQEKIGQIVSTWSQFGARMQGLLTDDWRREVLEQDMLTDLHFATKYAKSKLYNLITTPTQVGGFGYVPVGASSLRMEGLVLVEVSREITKKGEKVAQHLKHHLNQWGETLLAPLDFFPFFKGMRTLYAVKKWRVRERISVLGSEWQVLSSTATGFRGSKQWWYGENPAWFQLVNAEVAEVIKSGSKKRWEEYFDASDWFKYRSLTTILSRRVLIEVLTGKYLSVSVNSYNYNVMESWRLGAKKIMLGLITSYLTFMHHVSYNFLVDLCVTWTAWLVQQQPAVRVWN
jgi:hypothetical protein